MRSNRLRSSRLVKLLLLLGPLALPTPLGGARLPLTPRNLAGQDLPPQGLEPLQFLEQVQLPLLQEVFLELHKQLQFPVCLVQRLLRLQQGHLPPSLANNQPTLVLGVFSKPLQLLLAFRLHLQLLNQELPLLELPLPLRQRRSRRQPLRQSPNTQTRALPESNSKTGIAGAS